MCGWVGGRGDHFLITPPRDGRRRSPVPALPLFPDCLRIQPSKNLPSAYAAGEPRECDRSADFIPRALAPVDALSRNKCVDGPSEWQVLRFPPRLQPLPPPPRSFQSASDAQVRNQPQHGVSQVWRLGGCPACECAA